MNVQQLNKVLCTLITQGHGRKPVCVDKSSFTHPLEGDGAVILDLQTVLGPAFIVMTDDDGGTKTNKDGTESGRWTVLFKGLA